MIPGSNGGGSWHDSRVQQEGGSCMILGQLGGSNLKKETQRNITTGNGTFQARSQSAAVHLDWEGRCGVKGSPNRVNPNAYIDPPVDKCVLMHLQYIVIFVNKNIKYYYLLLLFVLHKQDIPMTTFQPLLKLQPWVSVDALLWDVSWGSMPVSGCRAGAVANYWKKNAYLHSPQKGTNFFLQSI